MHSAFAQVTASVDRPIVALGQSLTLTIVLPDSGDKPDLSPLNANFEVYGTSSSSQMSIVNGKTSSQSSYQVTLMPRNLGKQVIPALKVGNDTTNSVLIEVTQNGGSGSGKQAAGKHRELFADVSSYKQTSYVGVPVVVSLKIYIAVNVANLSLEQFDIPNAKIQQQGKSIQYQDTQGNTNYQVVEQKYLVTPTSAGDITIPALKIRGVRTGQSQGIGFFAMTDQQPFVINSKPLTIKVKSTPAGVNPMTWLPANSLNVSESWSQSSRQVKVGEAITRTITINTDGVMASSLPELEFSKPQGVNAYPDKANSSDVVVGGKLRAHKTFKIAYVPTQAGKLEFPATKVEWWDLKSDTMQHAQIPATSFEVISDGKTAASTVAANTVEDNKAASSQSVTNNKNKAPKSIWFYIALAIGALWLISILAFAVWWRSRKKSKQTNKNVVIAEAKSVKPVSVETITSEKEALNAFVAACKNQDIPVMNKTLLRFASLHYNRPIYTVSDIKDLNNSNAKLAELIEQFNLALYRDASFDNFGEFATEVSALILKKKMVKAKNKSLDEFYPR